MICRGEERIYTRLVKGWVRSNRFFQSPKSVSVTNCMTCQFFSLISLYSLQKAGNSDCTAAHSYRSLASSFFFYSWFSLSLSLCVWFLLFLLLLHAIDMAFWICSWYQSLLDFLSFSLLTRTRARIWFGN